MSQSTTTQIASWKDYFELSTGGLGRKYQYKDRSVIDLPEDLPQPPSDYPVMFSGCHDLVNIEALAKWDASKMTSTTGMFNHCRSLVEISSLMYWDMSNVTDMSYMFNCCYALIDVRAIVSWDVSKVRRMSYIFNGCHELPRFARVEVYDQQTFNCFIERFLKEEKIIYVPIDSDSDVGMYQDFSMEEEEDVYEEWNEATMGPHPFPENGDILTSTMLPSAIPENTYADPESEDDLSMSMYEDLTMTLTPDAVRKLLESDEEDDY